MRETIRLLILSLLVLTHFLPAAGQVSISLHGEWAFRLDPDNTGLKEQWYADQLPDRVKLPGSLDEQGIGVFYSEVNLGRLTPQTRYVGMAWYQKEVNIPEYWNGKAITLFLERACWETTVYVDGIPAGSQNSLSVPHEYNLSALLTPGNHRLTICVDNTVKINIGHTLGNMLWPHALSAETQTNWNGIIGEIKLTTNPLIRIGEVLTFPDFTSQTTKVRLTILNHSGDPQKGSIDLSCSPDGGIADQCPRWRSHEV